MTDHRAREFGDTATSSGARPRPRAARRLPGLRRAGEGLRAPRRVAGDLRRRPHGDHRSVGIGQVDDARPARRARPAHGGHRRDRGDRHGRRSTTPARSRLRGDSIGFVFQQFHLIPHLDALNNVATALLFRGLTTKERRERAHGRARGRRPRAARGSSPGADVGRRATARRASLARSSPSRCSCSPTSPPVRSTRTTRRW